MCNYKNININPVRDYRPVENRCHSNPVRDYRPVENRCHKASHAVRYATCMLQIGYIPYGMYGLCEMQFSTGRYIPNGMSNNKKSIFNLNYL